VRRYAVLLSRRDGRVGYQYPIRTFVRVTAIAPKWVVAGDRLIRCRGFVVPDFGRSWRPWLDVLDDLAVEPVYRGEH
jgi:hypothetical protein